MSVHSSGSLFSIQHVSYYYLCGQEEPNLNRVHYLKLKEASQTLKNLYTLSFTPPIFTLPFVPIRSVLASCSIARYSIAIFNHFAKITHTPKASASQCVLSAIVFSASLHCVVCARVCIFIHFFPQNAQTTVVSRINENSIVL